MVDQEEFDRWQGAADEALEGARVNARAGLHHWACFLAEQAAQLAIKGLLHGLGTAPWGHDLVVLGAGASEALGDRWPRELDAPLRRLSQFYIATRYPDANPAGRPSAHYGLEDAETAIELAAGVCTKVASVWAAVTDER